MHFNLPLLFLLLFKTIHQENKPNNNTSKNRTLTSTSVLDTDPWGKKCLQLCYVVFIFMHTKQLRFHLYTNTLVM